MVSTYEKEIKKLASLNHITLERIGSAAEAVIEKYVQIVHLLKLTNSEDRYVVDWVAAYLSDQKRALTVSFFVDILKQHMSENDALERSNNLAQAYLLDPEGFGEDVEVMIIPNSEKAGITDETIRKNVVEQILKINK